ncbi:MAG: membrane protein insertion efficiency factor YidD [Flavobacteriales bacterium]
MKRFFIVLAIFPVRVYQWVISPLFPSSCRYEPTCSQYMAEAMSEWGVLRGWWMGIRRLARCHPWGGCGYDPIPKREKK